MSQSDPTFSEFYAGYLAHHRDPWNRALHLAAKLLALAGLAAAVYERSVLLLLAAPVLAVAPCWIGHLLFEGDRPVSWTQPSASLLGTLGRICCIGRGAHRVNRDDSSAGRDSLTGLASDLDRPRATQPPRPAGVRPYYSFAADLRMCGAMLGMRARPGRPALSATPASEGKPGASSAPT